MDDFSKFNGEGTVLRKAQMREVAILQEVDKICKKHDIKYWIDFGTLLGTVRHGGFIPWDDDLDICMLSSDYTKFIETARNELPDWLFLQNKKTDPSYRRTICKVRDLNSLFIERHEDFMSPYKKGIFIDIFEVVEYPKVSRKMLGFLSKWAKKTDQFFNVPQYINFKNIAAGMTFPIIKLFINVLWGILHIRKSNNLGFRLEHNPYNSFISKDKIFPLSEIEFEGIMLPAPNDYDAVLKSYYKDYMKLPKEEDRWIHSQFIYFKE